MYNHRSFFPILHRLERPAKVPILLFCCASFIFIFFCIFSVLWDYFLMLFLFLFFFSFFFLLTKIAHLILHNGHKSDWWKTIQCIATAIVTCVKRYLYQLHIHSVPAAPAAAVVVAIMWSHQHHQAIIMNTPRR